MITISWRSGAAVLAAIAPFLSAPAHAAEPPFNESAREIRDYRDVALSPDGSEVAAVITASTAEGGQTHVWVMGADGTRARQMTFSAAEGEPGEAGAAWSNDGAALFFMAKRGEAQRLYRLPMLGGEAQGLVLARTASGALQSGWGLKPTDAVETPLSAYEVSPDDKWIALVAADGDTATRTAQVKKKDDAVRVSRDDAKKVRLYLVEAATGKAREITLPDKVESASWNPASDELAVVTTPASQDLGPAARVWRVRAADGGSAQFEALPKTTISPRWTPNGLVYLAQCEQDAPPGCLELYAYDAASRSSHGLTGGLKGSLVDNFVVARDGRSVVTPVQTGFRQRLARIDLVSGALSWIDFPQPVVFALGGNRGETGWAFLAGGPLQPKSAFFAARLGDAPTRLAGPAVVPANWPETPSHAVSWTNAGLTIEGMLYLPAIAPGLRAPLVVVVHGGPSGLFQDRSYNLANLLVAQGWAVLQTNPRGSLGYGASFLAANKNDLGGADYADIMAGVDRVIRDYPIDPGRMSLVGYSYGGEMAGFVEGRTGRFKAIVSGAPVIDQFSEYGTEDSSFYDRWYFGKPWEHFADAWRQSPLARVGHARTPFLLLQGDDDPTDPLGQSKEMRRALEQAGVPVALVTYPRETHATLSRTFAGEPSREPWHGLDLHRRMIDFIAAAFAGKPSPLEP